MTRLLARFVKEFAPRHSRRRLGLSFIWDAVRRPRSIFHRLSEENFANHSVCKSLQIRCNVCAVDSVPFYDFPDVRLRREHGIGLLRETLNCRACGASMRDRQMAYGLMRVIEGIAREPSGVWSDLLAMRAAPLPELAVFDTDSFSSINRQLKGLPWYRHSQFRPDMPAGISLADGSINVDLLSMPFETGSLDVVMSSDVMEHVENDERAHREIYRCLRVGGSYVFTVPYDPCLAVTRRLTQPSGVGTPSFLLQKQLHGDPLSDGGGILAHRIYGKNFREELQSMGFATTLLEINSPEAGIFGGDLFIATKEG
jgi:SAM-dependent methyltransferase